MAMTVKVGMKVAVALQAAMVAVVEAVEAMGPRYTRRASRRFVLW